MNNRFLKDDSVLSILYLLRWLLIAGVMAPVSLLIAHGFVFLTNHMNLFVHKAGGPSFLWTMAGGVLVVVGIYSWAPQAVIESVPAYTRGLNVRGRLRLRDTLGKLGASLLTIGFLGAGGIVGPLGRICAGTGSFLASLFRKFQIRNEDYKLACICGFSASTAAIFHSPIAAGILAVEISQKTGLNYRRLFPSILASSLAVFFSKALGVTPFYSFSILQLEPEPLVLGPVMVLALFSGFLGRFYNFLYRFLSRHLGREIKAYRGIRVAGAGGAVTLLAYLFHSDLIGTSRTLFEGILTDTSLLYGRMGTGLPLFWVCIILLLIKILANSVIVASGYSAGFIGTMMLAGMLLGVSFSSLFGIEFYSADYYALVTAGFAGVLASCTNVPIAAAVLTSELFGFGFGMPAAAAAIIGFQINRHNTIYDKSENPGHKKTA